MSAYIKICGVTDAETAHQVAKLGPNFIGIVFANSSPRKVTTTQAKLIAAAAKLGGAEPVAIFAEQSALDIQVICAETQINTIQLHGDSARQALVELPCKLKKLFMVPITPEGNIAIDMQLFLSLLNPQQDYLLFDNSQNYTGKQIPLIDFNQFAPFKFFVAGGLNEKNISETLSACNAHGVDVSSGVEIKSGIKDLIAVEKFILAVRGHRHENQ